MALRFRTFVQILMAVLALGFWTPQSVCMAATSDTGKTCCCTEASACGCLPDKSCELSCTLTQVPISDKDVTGQTAVAPTAHSYSLLFAIAPVQITSPVLASALRKQNANASPPLGGSPPQSKLCLWLI